MTGRGMGRCGGANAQGDTNRGGRGGGIGRGRGRGCQGGSGGGRRGWRFWLDHAEAQAPVGETGRQVLQRQAEVLREQLARIEDRLKDPTAPEPEKTR